MEKCLNECQYLDTKHELCWEYGVNLEIKDNMYQKCEACKSKTEQNAPE